MNQCKTESQTLLSERAVKAGLEEEPVPEWEEARPFWNLPWNKIV